MLAFVNAQSTSDTICKNSTVSQRLTSLQTTLFEPFTVVTGNAGVHAEFMTLTFLRVYKHKSTYICVIVEPKDPT